MTLVVEAPETRLWEVLARLPDAVVMRGYRDPRSTFERGGDIDVLVTNPEEAERVLLAAFGPPLRRTVRAQVRSLAYEWGAVDLVDLVHWRGAEYLPAEAVRKGAVAAPGGVMSMNPVHEALVCLLESLLWGGFFQRKYEPFVAETARLEPERMREALVHAAGEQLGGRLFEAASLARPDHAERLVPQLRRAVWWRAWRRAPGVTLRRALAHYRREVALRWRPPVPWFAVLGPDGSGKSAVLDKLERALPPSLGGVVAHHWRPGLVRPDARGDGGPVTDPHGVPPRGAVASLAKLALLWLDWNLGYVARIVHERAKERIVVFDRCYFDLLVDPRRYRYGGSARLAAWVGKAIPQPVAVVVLDAPVDDLRARKVEVAYEETVRQRSAYRDLAETIDAGPRASAVVIDASRSLDVVVADVRAFVLHTMRTWSAT